MLALWEKFQQVLERRDAFEKIFISEDRGIETACKATAPKSFWIKYYIPSSWHSTMKKVFHLLVDKK